MTHGPITEETREGMNALAKIINIGLNGESLDKKWGFALLVFPFGEVPEGRMNYISNGKREDMVVALKEFVARNEGLYHEVGTRQ